jgi:hypothetical protein
MEIFPPRVNVPELIKVVTAASVLRTNTKLVNSIPNWPPAPNPPSEMADGADQVPSGRRHTISPEPKRTDPRKPALKTLQITSPYGRVSSIGGGGEWY